VSARQDNLVECSRAKLRGAVAGSCGTSR
jgi:hypothetical protein